MMVGLSLKEFLLQKIVVIKLLSSPSNMSMLYSLLNKGIIRAVTLVSGSVLVFLKYDLFSNSSLSEFRFLAARVNSKFSSFSNFHQHNSYNWFA